jgi:hypothetical protein
VYGSVKKHTFGLDIHLFLVEGAKTLGAAECKVQERLLREVQQPQQLKAAPPPVKG